MIKIRLSAPPAELDPAIAAARGAYAVTCVSDRYPNRRDTAERVYIEATGPAGDPIDPSPLAQADDAKRRRDLAGEVSVLMKADADLKAQPWYPLQRGDVVLCAFDLRTPGEVPYGETYIAVPREEVPYSDLGGSPMLRMISCSDLDDGTADAGRAPYSFDELWFEAGPSRLTVIRAGRIVHGRPLR